MIVTWPQSSGLNAGLSLWLPLNDLGSGQVNTTPATSAGSPTATFTRATTATTVLSTGLIGSVSSGVPRSCYTGAGIYLGYLAEQASTNLVIQSADLTDAAWVKAGCTISANAVASPDGTTTADKIAEDNTTAPHNVLQVFTKAASGITYAASVYLKQAERTMAFISMDDTANSVRVFFNLATGAVGTNATGGAGFTFGSASVTAAANGFYRCTIVFTSSTSTTLRFGVYTTTADGTTSHAGATGSGIYAWGHQLEQLGFATSYIPTGAATVTRNADVLTYAAASNTNTSAQSFYAEVNPIQVAAAAVIASYGTAGVDSWVNFVNSTATLRQQMFASSAGVEDIQTAGVFTAGTSAKVASKYSASDTGLFLNGTKGASTTNPSGTPAAPTTLYIAAQSSGTQLNGCIKNVRIWTRALADSQLVSLTA